MAFPSPARVGLFGISACLEAPSEKDQDEVEEATTEALSGCVCVCVCVRALAFRAARREHQTTFEELERLTAMVSCFHETVLPAAHVGLFGISPCLEASEKDQDEVEGATTEALPGSLFLLVRASQFCVAPAGQTKLRSGGLREGWLTHVGGCAPCCRPRTRPWRRRFAISLAQVVLAFRCGWSRELLTNSDELEGLLMLAGCLCADR